MNDPHLVSRCFRAVVAQHPDGLRVLRDVDAALAFLTGHVADLSPAARQIVQRLVDAGVHPRSPRPPEPEGNDA